MRLSELQQKNLVDLNNGKIIGRIIDAEIEENDGKIINFSVEKTKLKSLFNNESDVFIKFDQIKKIGEDVVLVDLT